MSQTKGEKLMNGIEQVKSGLSMIGSIGGNKQDFIRLLVSSQVASKNLKDLMRDNAIMKSMVFTLVRARNTRLAPETVDKVITDFLDILFDLSQPVPEEDTHEQQ